MMLPHGAGPPLQDPHGRLPFGVGPTRHLRPGSRVEVVSDVFGRVVACRGVVRGVGSPYRTREEWIDLVVEFDEGTWSVVPVRATNGRPALPALSIRELDPDEDLPVAGELEPGT